MRTFAKTPKHLLNRSNSEKNMHTLSMDSLLDIGSRAPGTFVKPTLLTDLDEVQVGFAEKRIGQKQAKPLSGLDGLQRDSPVLDQVHMGYFQNKTSTEPADRLSMDFLLSLGSRPPGTGVRLVFTPSNEPVQEEVELSRRASRNVNKSPQNSPKLKKRKLLIRKNLSSMKKFSKKTLKTFKKKLSSREQPQEKETEGSEKREKKRSVEEKREEKFSE